MATQDTPSHVDRIDDIWEGADALLREMREWKLGDDPEAAKALGRAMACLEVVADAGGRLADIIAVSEVVVDGYHLSDSDKARVVFALRRIVETGDRDPSIIASQ